MNLPSGTVTFFFTDIEGSTKLAQQFPAALPALLAPLSDLVQIIPALAQVFGLQELPFNALWAEGRALTMEQAIAHALKETDA